MISTSISAVNYAAFGAFIGAGQTCVCASRHIVQASIYDEFVEKLKAKTQTIRIGDPFDPDDPARTGDLGAAARSRADLFAVRPRRRRAARDRRCRRKSTRP